MKCLVLSLLLVTVAAEEKWSWGRASSSRSGKALSTTETIPIPADSVLVARKLPIAETQIPVQSKSTAREARKVTNGKGNGISQPRFKGLKKTMCEYGIGFDCKEYEYDYIEIADFPSYSGYSGPSLPYPPGAGAISPGYAPVNHGYGNAINPSSVLHVQPVALKPVGTPIQAVPLGGGGGHAYSGSANIGPVHSGGYVEEYPSTGYGAPQPSYSPPVYEPSLGKDSFHSSFAVHDANEYDSAIRPAGVVKHIHEHTHIYNGPVGGSGYDYSYSSSNRNPSIFSDKSSSSLPIIPPRPNLIHRGRESCQCVSAGLCSTSDIVGRSSRLPRLDARNSKSNILSNSTKTERITRQTTETNSTNNSATRKRRQITNTFSPDGQARQFDFPATDCRFNEVCCLSTRISRSSRFSTCGRRNANGITGRVKNTDFREGEAEFGEYPWQAAILREEEREAVYVCAASLIDAEHVLTAAHCVKGINPRTLIVRLGEWNVNSLNEFYAHKETSVREIVVHPQFYAGLLTNDIAVLRLNDPIDFKSYPHISPVCLPDDFADFTGRTCHVSGWGKDAFGKQGSFQNVLKEVEIPIIDHYKCQTALRQTRLGRDFDLDDGMICAGGEEGKDACKGDGGGPLVCEDLDGSSQLAGIVSWGVGCGERGVPGVYVKVPAYVRWIKSIIRS